jgi:hypothetical protein
METRGAPNDDQDRYWNSDEAGHWLVAVLDAARLTDIDIDIEPVTQPLWMGHDVADTVAFPNTTRIGQSLFPNADAAATARVTDAMQTALEPHLASDGVGLQSRAWLVTARNPHQAEGDPSWRSSNA